MMLISVYLMSRGRWVVSSPRVLAVLMSTAESISDCRHAVHCVVQTQHYTNIILN